MRLVRVSSVSSSIYSMMECYIRFMMFCRWLSWGGVLVVELVVLVVFGLELVLKVLLWLGVMFGVVVLLSCRFMVFVVDVRMMFLLVCNYRLVLWC